MSDPGRYRLLQRIGSGGMAEVLEAVAVGDHGFERRVAIKRLVADSDPMYERMFIDEARISSQLHHANIVAVIDYGVVDGRPFQVLEYVDGIDAGALIARSGPLPAELALHVCAMVGHALDYAHAACGANGAPLGIVHRDVTPGNVLVGWSGDVKLGDFGIARASVRVERTLDGTTKGTPQFMAPEQMLGGEIDRRTDVFALGCVLHAMVAGTSPLATADQLARVAVGAELELDPALPPDVRAIIARATRAVLRERYADAGVLVAALTQALAARGAVDPRTKLRAWLQPLHPAPVAARGKLDALLDLDLVLAPSSGELRQFTSIADATRTEPPPRRVLATAVTRRPPLRSWTLPLAACALAAIAIVVVIEARSTTTTPPPAPDVVEHWPARHKIAARELGAWAHAYPDAAAAMFDWDDGHPAAATELVTWAIDNPGATLDDFLATRPRWRNFAPIVAQHRAACDAFVAWIRAYPPAVQTLIAHPRGLALVGRQL